MKRFLLVAGLWSCTLSLSWGDAVLTLPDLLRKAREQNPDIQAAERAWKVQRAQTGAASAWPDPTVSFIDERFPHGSSDAPPEKIQHYRIEQPIPFPGKITQDTDMKRHEALIAEAAYRVRVLDVFNDVKMRYFQLYLTDEKIKLAAQAVEVMRSALGTAQGRLAANQGGASDVFMAQGELRLMENQLFEQQQQRTLIVIELNTLLNQPTETPLGAAQAPALRDVPATRAEIQTLAERNAPLYLSALHETNHSKAMQKRQRLEYAPDFGIMYEYEKADMGDSGRQIGVSMTFPLWFQRPWGLNQSAEEHVLEAQANAQAMKNMVLKMVGTEYTEIQTHLRLARNYESDILPAALANLRVTRQSYAAGQGDFLRLLEAFRTWIERHNEYQEQVYHTGEHWSELERWVGVDPSQAKEALEQTKWDKLENGHAHQ